MRRPMVMASGPAESPLPEATAVRIAISRMAMRSSTMRMPTTNSRSLPLTPCSSNAFAMIVVLEIAMIAAGEEALQGRPAEEPSDHVSQPNHDAGLEDGRQARGRTDSHQLAEAELEAEREHQQDHAELGQRLDNDAVRDERDRHVRPDDQAGDDVSEDDRLAEPLEQDGGDRGDAEDDRQGFEKLVGVVHSEGVGVLRRHPAYSTGIRLLFCASHASND